jgi:hypothetical protein
LKLIGSAKVTSTDLPFSVPGIKLGNAFTMRSASVSRMGRLMRAGEMNFAPTKMVHVFEDERVEGSGRNEFRPYKHSAYLYRPEKS